MPWFVAKRPVEPSQPERTPYVYRVVSEADIETIGPEWDWASSAFDTLAEAEREADELFWDDPD